MQKKCVKAGEEKTANAEVLCLEEAGILLGQGRPEASI